MPSLSKSKCPPRAGASDEVRLRMFCAYSNKRYTAKSFHFTELSCGKYLDQKSLSSAMLVLKPLDAVMRPSFPARLNKNFLVEITDTQ
jgi:hypothetical protein